MTVGRLTTTGGRGSGHRPVDGTGPLPRLPIQAAGTPAVGGVPPAGSAAIDLALWLAGLGWPVVTGPPVVDLLPGPMAWGGGTRDRARIVRAWLRRPDASVLVLAGLAFDLLEVPGPVAVTVREALEGSGRWHAPVAVGPDGRMFLWLRPGARLVSEARSREPWPYAPAGLLCHGVGAALAAPPQAGLDWLVRPPGTGVVTLPHLQDVLPLVLPACRAARTTAAEDLP